MTSGCRHSVKRFCKGKGCEYPSAVSHDLIRADCVILSDLQSTGDELVVSQRIPDLQNVQVHHLPRTDLHWLACLEVLTLLLVDDASVRGVAAFVVPELGVQEKTKDSIWKLHFTSQLVP